MAGLDLENVGGSEQNGSVIANVQSDDLWPSRMQVATHILCQKLPKSVDVG